MASPKKKWLARQERTAVAAVIIASTTTTTATEATTKSVTKTKTPFRRTRTAKKD